MESILIEKSLYEEMEEAFSSAKEAEKLFKEKKDLLERNRFTICDEKGDIPARYAVSFNKLNDQVDELEKKFSEKQEVVVNLVEKYVVENGMGNLVYEKNVEGTEFFFKSFINLYEKEFPSLSKAINSLDIAKVVGVVDNLRQKFLNATFPAYCNYAKKLSFNRP